MDSDNRRKRIQEYLNGLTAGLPGDERIFLEEEAEQLSGRVGGIDPEAARLFVVLVRESLRSGNGVFRLTPAGQAVHLLVREEAGFIERQEIPRIAAQGLQSFVARLAGLPDKAERPAEGEFPLTVQQREYDALASVYPTIFGPSLFVSLRSRTDDTPGLETVGLADADLSRYLNALRRKSGLVAVSGPKGSGKSGFVYASLKHLARPGVTVMTAEDPVKKVLGGIVQSQVSSAAGFTWMDALKGMLRHQSDVVYLSEARDKATLGELTKTALTGRLVFTTLPARNALSTLHRLRDSGIENFITAEAMTAVVSPRLVRRNCPDCRVEYVPDAKILDLYGMNAESLNFRRGLGCAKCSGTGFRGVRMIYELLTFDDALRQAIRDGAEGEELLKAAESAGFCKFFDSVQFLIFEGEVMLEEFHAAMCNI